MVSIKNPTPPLTPAPVPILNNTIDHPLTNPTPTHTHPSTFSLSGTVSLTRSQHQYPTEERDPEELERTPTKSGPPTDETAYAVDEQSQLVLLVESDESDTFSVPRNPESDSRSGGRGSISIADEPIDVSPHPKPICELPADALKVEESKHIEHTATIEDGRSSAQPEDLVMRSAQELDTYASLSALTTQPFPSIPEVTEQDDSIDKPSEDGQVGTHGELSGANGYVVEETDPKIEHAKDVRDQAESALLPSAPITPGAEEGSLAAEDQPHPAERVKKNPDVDAVSFISVRDFCCV